MDFSVRNSTDGVNIAGTVYRSPLCLASRVSWVWLSANKGTGLAHWPLRSSWSPEEPQNRGCLFSYVHWGARELAIELLIIINNGTHSPCCSLRDSCYPPHVVPTVGRGSPRCVICPSALLPKEETEVLALGYGGKKNPCSNSYSSRQSEWEKITG